MALFSKIFRFIWALWAGFVFLISLLLVTPVYLVIFVFLGKKGVRIGHKISRVWSWFLFTFFLIRIKIHNREILDKNQPYIFVSNHASQLDIPVWALATDHFFKFLAKKELIRVPLLGYIIKHLYLTVDRQSFRARAESMEVMKNALSNGTSVVIFPEGSRNRTNKPLMRFFDGAFQLGVQSGYPIAVLTIKNSGSLLPAGSLFQMAPGTIHCYWEGVLSTEEPDTGGVQELKKQAKFWMEQRLENH